jgi:signal peptidase II
LKHSPPLVVLRGFVELCYAENTGVAFSFLDDLRPSVRRPLLVGIPLLEATAVTCLLWYFRARSFTALLPFVLILSGAAGNLLDRLRHGYVVDFVYVHAKDVFDWPIFNVADTLLVAGVALLALQHVLSSKDRFNEL